MMIQFQLLMLIVFVFLGAMAENPLVDLSTRHELASLAGYGEQKLSTVVVSGTLLCDATNSPSHSHPIHGASVAVTCHANRKTRRSNWVRSKTDEYGDFLIDLPSHLHAIPNMEKRCLVRIVRLPRKSPCHRGFTGKHARITLSSSGNGIRTYSTDRIHLTHKHPHRHLHPLTRGRKTVDSLSHHNQL